MNIYHLRTISADYTAMIALGKLLGVITEYDGTIQAPGGCWDYIGPIYTRTGGSDEKPIFTPLKDPDGNDYIHANLLTPLALKEVAIQMAADNPEIAAGLADLGKYFLLDAEGNARAPAQPHRVFFGV